MHKGVCAFVAKLKLHLLTCMDYNWLYLSMSCDNQLWINNEAHTEYNQIEFPTLSGKFTYVV